MATLADINKTLQSQGSVLEAVADNTNKTGRAIDSFLKSMEISRKKQLESDLENKRTLSQRAADAASSAGQGAKNVAGAVADKFTLPAGLLTGAGLTALGTSLFGGLAKRGIPAAIGLTFADEIGNWVESQTGKKELGEAAERATIGGSFGLLLGKRFGLVGAAIGAIATDENITKATEVGKNLQTAMENFGLELPSLTTILENVSSVVGDGLDGINALLTADWDTFQENFGETAGLLAGMALLIAPGPFMAGIKGLTKFARGPLGKRFLAISAAVAAGTFVYDKFFDQGGEDGIGLDDVAGGAAIAGATAYGAKRLLTPKQADAIAGRGEFAPKATPPKTKIVKKDGKEFVQSKDGKLYQRGTPQADMIETRGGTVSKPTPKWYDKFPKIKGLRGVPGTSLLFAALDSAQAAAVMMDDNLTENEKIERLGPLIGGSVGALGFGALGAVLGSAFPGPGTALGGLVGSLAGYFGGDWAGTQVAKFLLDEGEASVPSESAPGSGGRNNPRTLTTDERNLFGGYGDSNVEPEATEPTGTISGRNRARTSKGGPRQTLEPIVDAPAASSADKSIVFGNGNTTITNSAPQALMMNNGGAVDNGSMDMLATSPR